MAKNETQVGVRTSDARTLVPVLRDNFSSPTGPSRPSRERMPQMTRVSNEKRAHDPAIGDLRPRAYL